MNKQHPVGENRSTGLECDEDRCGKGECLPKYLHEKAIWPKCHFGTLKVPFSWTRELPSTASKPSKGERVMAGNGSRAMAGQFIGRMDSPYHSPYRTAISKRCMSDLNKWWHATQGWNQRENGYHRGGTPPFSDTLRESWKSAFALCAVTDSGAGSHRAYRL